ncbi:SPFH domain-containing protein [Sulfurospirillum arcachonense]|uniref:SPFH domain-containing protein n=1 Tax=Sulfurospirillum arcachonense TaxID=57666 RepID=UPI0004B8439C|nr:stomatin-like protein [Sulfurospirillum arcachonense]
MYIQGIDTSMIIPIAIILALVIIIYKGVKIVSQADAWIIERLGKYHKTLEGGFHLIIPILDSVRAVLTKQEQIINIPGQSVITKDNVNISVDGIVFIQVETAKEAVYGVVDYKQAIANLATTSLRAEIGQLALDETLSSRDTLNKRILLALDEATQKWGVKTMRVELRDISVPQEIEEAMNMQMKAEREKRAIELTAIANKEAVIRNAEGLKQQTVLEAEAIERMAEAKKYEQIALAEGQKEAMDMINEAITKNSSSAEYLLTKDRIAAFNELAKSDSKDKVIVPYEATELIGSLSMVSEFFGNKTK